MKLLLTPLDKADGKQWAASKSEAMERAKAKRAERAAFITEYRQRIRGSEPPEPPLPTKAP